MRAVYDLIVYGNYRSPDKRIEEVTKRIKQIKGVDDVDYKNNRLTVRGETQFNGSEVLTYITRNGFGIQREYVEAAA